MAEYGKIVKITFDVNLRYISIENSKNAFTVSATEKTYVPGGEDFTEYYTVTQIEADDIRAEKYNFVDGNETDVAVLGEELALSGTKGTDAGVGYSNFTFSNNTSGLYGQVFDITEPTWLRTSKARATSILSNVTVSLHKLTPGTWQATADNLITSQIISFPVANQYTTVTWDILLLPGRYWAGSSYYGGTLLLNRMYNLSGEYPATNPSVPGVTIRYTVPYNSNTPLNTAYWYSWIDYQFAPVPAFYTSGNWTFPIDCNAITSVFGSIIRWTESDKPVGTDITLYTAVNTSSTVEPTVWTEQTFNGRDADSLTISEDLTGKYLWLKIELETTDTSKTPIISDPYFRIVKMNDQKSIVLLLEEWKGINRATGAVNVIYTKSSGTLASAATGYPRVQDFNENFTPTSLQPVNNPGELEALELSLTDYTLVRTYITFIWGYEAEALELSLTDYTITRTHVDDLPP